MKHFMATVKYKKGNDYFLIIYRIKNNIIERIGAKDFTIWNATGEESEVYLFLIDKKIIPKKANDFSKTPWRSAGYYVHHNPYCRITII